MAVIFAMGASGHLDTLFGKFNHSLKAGTPAEKRLARYYLDHPGDISYETAASVADRLDLSPMTVGRFLRAMDIDSLRLGARPVAAAQTEPVHKNQGMGEQTADYGHVRDHVDALRSVQALALQPVWRQMVDLLSRCSEIYMTAMPSVLPMAHYFANRLAETRDGVRMMSGHDGTYLELLGNRREDCLLTVIDDPVGTQRLQRLCRAARDNGHRVIMLTDNRSSQLDELCDLVVPGPGRTHRGGMDPVGLTAMIELAVSAVMASKGPFALERAGKVAELQRAFIEPA